MSQISRPLSPHLQVYRWQVSQTLSIIHRGTGVMLSVGAVALVALLLALASGQAAYATISGLFSGVIGQIALVGWSFCFFYHLCNGLRHLAWDAGYGFERHKARRSGLLVVAVSAVLTISVWILALTRVPA